MLTMTYNRRQNLSIMLVISMIFSVWMTTAPINEAQAGILSSIGSVAKSLFVNVGAAAAGVVGGALGAAVGGGPLGMGIGAVAGFVLGKKVLNWTTSSVANFATVAGAIAGGFLCAGMGLPMLAVGVVGGALLGRLVTKGIQKLFGNDSTELNISNTELSAEAAAAEDAAISDYMSQLAAGNSTTSNVSTTSTAATTTAATETTSSGTIDAQTAYNNYIEAYQAYAKATQDGDATAAQIAYKQYKTNLELYNTLLK